MIEHEVINYVGEVRKREDLEFTVIGLPVKCQHRWTHAHMPRKWICLDCGKLEERRK